MGLALGGEAGKRLCKLLRMPTSARTLLRILRHENDREKNPVRVLGVDDWAMCKGRTYGTILVDLERHRPIDLLSDRNATTLATWLQCHPEVQIIRNRFGVSIQTSQRVKRVVRKDREFRVKYSVYTAKGIRLRRLHEYSTSHAARSASTFMQEPFLNEPSRWSNRVCLILTWLT